MPDEKKLTSTDISGLIQGSFNDSRSESIPIEKEKKRKNSSDADAIYSAAARYNIEETIRKFRVIHVDIYLL